MKPHRGLPHDVAFNAPDARGAVSNAGSIPTRASADPPRSSAGEPPARPLPRARDAASPWLTYAEAAAYCGWSVTYLRNLVCAGQVPVYGRLRVRRFRREMLDLFLTDPDAAMRRFRAERNTHGS